MTGENAINTVMSAFLGTAISLYAADVNTAARTGNWLYPSLLMFLLATIIAGVSINIISNCWFNIRICSRSGQNSSLHQLRLAKQLGVFIFILLMYACCSGLTFRSYEFNLFDTYGWVIFFSLWIWLLSLTVLSHTWAKSSTDEPNSAPIGAEVR